MAKKKKERLPDVEEPTIPETPIAKRLSSIPPSNEDEADEKIVDAETLSEFVPEPIAPVRVETKPLARGTRAKGLGWKKDPHDPRDHSAKMLFGARRGIVPDSADLSQFVDQIRDQSITSSCVGQALARAIHVRLKSMGIDAEFPSAQAIYNVARSLDKYRKEEALTDDGSQPRQAMKGIREWGIVGEKVLPFDPAKINDPLPWDVMQRASCAMINNWYRIDTLGRDRVMDTCQALAKGFPVILGVEVDDAFENYSGGVLGAPKQRYGGHMLCLVGYRTKSGKREFRGVNSWGPGWGERGFFWTNEEWLMDSDASDLYVLSVSPR